MKHTLFFIGFLLSTSLAIAQTNAEIQDYVDGFVSAVSSQSPDPIMATALGATPEVVRIALTLKCKNNIRAISDEMDTTPSVNRVKELDDLHDRNMAVITALTGNPRPLQKFEEYRKKKDLERDKKRKEEEKERKEKLVQDEKDQMSISVGLLQDEVNKLKALKKQIEERGAYNLENIETNFASIYDDLEGIKSSYDAVKDYKIITSAFVEKGEHICDKATKLQVKILDLSKALKDGEAIVNSKIIQAKTRAGNCETIKDDVFVKASYQEARDAFGITKKAKDGALKYYVDINIHFEQIKRINASLDTLYTDINREPLEADNKLQERISKLLKPIPQYLEQLELGLEDSKNFPDKRQYLKKNIEASKASYNLQPFPEFEVKFNQLISEVESIKSINYIVDHVVLSNLHDKYNKLQQDALFSPSERELKDYYKIKHHAINCFSIESVKKEMDLIEEVFFSQFLLIKANEHLSAGCVPVATEITQEETTEKPAIVDSNVDPSIIPTDTTSSKPAPEKSVFGGLIIGGPSEITVGKGAQFIALDAAGDPYPNQSGFTWINTREDLMVLSSNGVSASGKTFRAGFATIILKFDGMTYYKDIEIKAKKGEDNNDDISERGHDEVNPLDEKCRNLIDLITISLHSSNTEAARTYTNRALALGCDVNAGAVAELITEIEDNKRVVQAQRDREYAAIEQKRQEENRLKRQQNNQNLLNLLGEKLNEISDKNEHQRHQNIDKRKSDFEKSQEKINQSFSDASKPSTFDNPDKQSGIGLVESIEQLGNSNKESQNSSSDEKPVYLGEWKVTHKCIQDDEQKTLSSYYTSQLGKQRVAEWSIGYVYSTGSDLKKGFISGPNGLIIEVPRPLPRGEIKVTREFDKVRSTRYHIVKRKVELTVNKNSFYGAITDYRKFYYTGRDAGVIKWTLKGKRK